MWWCRSRSPPRGARSPRSCGSTSRSGPVSGRAGGPAGAPSAAPGVPARPRAVCLAQCGHAGAHALQRGAEQPRAARRHPLRRLALPCLSRPEARLIAAGPEIPGCRDLDPGRFARPGRCPARRCCCSTTPGRPGRARRVRPPRCAPPGPGMWRWWSSAATWGARRARPGTRRRPARAWPPPGPPPSAWTAARYTVTRLRRSSIGWWGDPRPALPYRARPARPAHQPRTCRALPGRALRAELQHATGTARRHDPVRAVHG